LSVWKLYEHFDQKNIFIPLQENSYFEKQKQDIIKVRHAICIEFEQSFIDNIYNIFLTNLIVHILSPFDKFQKTTDNFSNQFTIDSNTAKTKRNLAEKYKIVQRSSFRQSGDDLRASAIASSESTGAPPVGTPGLEKTALQELRA
jgi:hypothetical protein